jgi:agmatinase
MQADSVFSGIATFGRLPYYPCLSSDAERFDIAFLGASGRHWLPKPRARD